MTGSWIDRISGESKWFKASQLERQGRLEEAMNLYLEEAKEQEPKSLALSALSMLSAAKCAAKLGKKCASEYFEEAGRRYEKYGDSIINVSPNSSAWAYKMASRCYNWAGDEEAADNVLRKAESLLEKIGEKAEKYFPLFKQYRPKKDEG